MTVSATAFKDVMARIANTVTVVTATSEGDPIGLTVSAFMSVSADPPIVLVCIDKATGSLGPMLDVAGFTVNLMPAGTGEEAMLFATPGADKFGGSVWSDPVTDEAGPVLASAFSHLECVVIDRHDVGDHWVLYGEVSAVGMADAHAHPLIWHNRAFAALTE